MMNRSIRLMALLAATVALAACDLVGPGEPDADPGPADIVLASPRADDGAVMFSIGGGPVDSITSRGYGIFASVTGPSSHRVVVNGDLVNGPIARVWVPDRAALGPYTLSIEQVATRGSYTQRDSDGYVLTLTIP
jgi:predicted small lipoprotein YifL